MICWVSDKSPLSILTILVFCLLAFNLLSTSLSFCSNCSNWDKLFFSFFSFWPSTGGVIGLSSLGLSSWGFSSFFSFGLVTGGVFCILSLFCWNSSNSSLASFAASPTLLKPSACSSKATFNFPSAKSSVTLLISWMSPWILSNFSPISWVPTDISWVPVFTFLPIVLMALLI